MSPRPAPARATGRRRARRATSSRRPSFGNAPAVVPLGEQRAVGGNHHVRIRHVRRFDRPRFGPWYRTTVSDTSVCADLVLPVGHRRAHDERGPRTELLGTLEVVPCASCAPTITAPTASESAFAFTLLALAVFAFFAGPLASRAGQVQSRSRTAARARPGRARGVDRGARSIRRDQRDHLQGLPQAHVVREDHAVQPVVVRVLCRRARSRTATSSRHASERRQRVGVFLLHQPRQAPCLVREQRRGQDHARPGDAPCLCSSPASGSRTANCGVVALVFGDARWRGDGDQPRSRPRTPRARRPPPGTSPGRASAGLPPVPPQNAPGSAAAGGASVCSRARRSKAP